ncbi:MAG: redoxin family protein [Polyangiaceae bacterium]|nr:redoxin family protein [Polyangiaceae bacterium]
MLIAAALCALLVAACDAQVGSAPSADIAAPHDAKPKPVRVTRAPLPGPPPPQAKLGVRAPDFTLSDLDGQSFTLSQHLGKTVVLEWFNPECPFVTRSHAQGSLSDTALLAVKEGVVWVAINSSGPGRQGHGTELNRVARAQLTLSHPILLDENGKVGRLYGARRTPQVFVVAPSGELVYRGAVDNSSDGEGKSAEGGKLVNYVKEALLAARSGRDPKLADTAPYGCGVKYAN